MMITQQTFWMLADSAVPGKVTFRWKYGSCCVPTTFLKSFQKATSRSPLKNVSCVHRIASWPWSLWTCGRCASMTQASWLLSSPGQTRSSAPWTPSGTRSFSSRLILPRTNTCSSMCSTRTGSPGTTSWARWNWPWISFQKKRPDWSESLSASTSNPGQAGPKSKVSWVMWSRDVKFHYLSYSRSVARVRRVPARRGQQGEQQQ